MLESMLAVICRLLDNYPQQRGLARSKPLLRYCVIHSSNTEMVPLEWKVMVILSDILPIVATPFRPLDLG